MTSPVRGKQLYPNAAWDSQADGIARGQWWLGVKAVGRDG